MTDGANPETFPSGIPKVKVTLPESPPEVLIITGMSGAGRSRAADVIADEGWYVDRGGNYLWVRFATFDDAAELHYGAGA